MSKSASRALYQGAMVVARRRKNVEEEAPTMAPTALFGQKRTTRVHNRYHSYNIADLAHYSHCLRSTALVWYGSDVCGAMRVCSPIQIVKIK